MKDILRETETGEPTVKSALLSICATIIMINIINAEKTSLRELVQIVVDDIHDVQ